MRRTILACAGMLLCVVALGSDSPREFDDTTKNASIEGTWRLIEFEYEGQKRRDPHIKEQTLTYRDGTYTVALEGGVVLHGSYRIDCASQLFHLDHIRADGPYPRKTYAYVYEIDGDRFRKASLLTEMTDKRPKGFNDKDVIIESYQRVK